MPKSPAIDISTTSFINVDLDLTSRRNLTALVEGLSARSRMHVLFNERIGRIFHATLELGGAAAIAGSAMNGAPDRIIRRMSRIVLGLPADLRAQWASASKRIFDLGFHCGDTRLVIPCLEPTTIRLVAELDATVAVTLYPPERTARSSARRTSASR